MSKHVLCVLAAACVLAGAPAAAQPLHITHSVASGDVTATTAVIWARASGPARMYVEVHPNPLFTRKKKVKTPQYAVATAETDFTAQLMLTDLEPDTQHYYRVWLTPPDPKHFRDIGGGEWGTFKTARGL